MSTTYRSTLEEFLALPETLERLEFVDGVVEVNANPNPLHNLAARNLGDMIRRSQLPGWVVLDSPIDWQFEVDRTTRVRAPDVTVIPLDQLEANPQRTAPLLVAEIVSPGSGTRDRKVKRAEFAAGGALHYWVVSTKEPSILAFRLDGATYVEVGHVVGDELLVVDDPWHIEIRPTDLLLP